VQRGAAPPVADFVDEQQALAAAARSSVAEVPDAAGAELHAAAPDAPAALAPERDAQGRPAAVDAALELVFAPVLAAEVSVAAERAVHAAEASAAPARGQRAAGGPAVEVSAAVAQVAVQPPDAAVAGV
jgi:hypothetical protein